jgi:hypothetical protein
MGSYSGLYFDNIQVDCEEDAAPSVCRILFRPADFLQVPLRKLPNHLRAYCKSVYDLQIYSVLHGSAAAAERRLSILGYSRARAEQAWNSAKIELIENAAQDRDDHTYESLHKMRKAVAHKFGPISYDEWQKKCTEILRARTNGIRHAEIFFLEGLHHTDMARDPLMWAAMQLYAFEPVRLWADITELIEYQYETKESIFGEDEVPSRFRYAFGKITLLTEGTTDSRILSASLNSFYPEARDLYSFVDFEGFRVEGGASPLARLLRGFAGAGLTDRFIAIFDNDAAGHEALASLKRIALPSNIRAITLPDLKFARDYPTIGPTGKLNADINGAAVSIESFLGRDALVREGELRPVRWSQWNSKAERYQGEIEGKPEVSERFLAAIKKIKNPEVLRQKFADMDALLCTIFEVFA